MVVSEPNLIIHNFCIGYENFVELWPENEVAHREIHVSFKVHLESGSCLDGGVILYDDSEISYSFSSLLTAENNTLSCVKINGFSALVFHDDLNARLCVLTKVSLDLRESFIQQSNDVSVSCFDWEEFVADQLEEGREHVLVNPDLL